MRIVRPTAAILYRTLKIPINFVGNLFYSLLGFEHLLLGAFPVGLFWRGLVHRLLAALSGRGESLVGLMELLKQFLGHFVSVRRLRRISRIGRIGGTH